VPPVLFALLLPLPLILSGGPQPLLNRTPLRIDRPLIALELLAALLFFRRNPAALLLLELLQSREMAAMRLRGLPFSVVPQLLESLELALISRDRFPRTLTFRERLQNSVLHLPELDCARTLEAAPLALNNRGLIDGRSRLGRRAGAPAQD
jgi:hypothetical protein